MAEGRSQPVHFGMDGERASAEQMDETRQQNMAYEYLCHLEEAKVWIESCIKEELPPTTELEEGLRNGVYLAKLGNFFAPKVVPSRKIYDISQNRYKTRGLHFRHTDNVSYWRTAMTDVGMPENLLPETTDVYDKKNMPRVVYCLHALSLFLHNLGLAPKIQDLYGKVEFTEEEISCMRQELEKYNIQMPKFSTIGGIIANEVPLDAAALHAAIIAINEAIEKQNPTDLIEGLQNPEAHLNGIEENFAHTYQDALYAVKRNKVENDRNIHPDDSLDSDHDAYDEMLTKDEIQDCIDAVNCETILAKIKIALETNDCDGILTYISNPCLSIKKVVASNSGIYMKELNSFMLYKQNNREDVFFTREEVEKCVHAANEISERLHARDEAVKVINYVLRNGSPDDLVEAFQLPEAQLPPVIDSAASLYFNEFVSTQADGETDLTYEELKGGTAFLTAIAKINICVDAGDADCTLDALKDLAAHIAGVDAECGQRYQNHLATARHGKISTGSVCPFLSHMDVQSAVDQVNDLVLEENDRIASIHSINDALKRGESKVTLDALACRAAQLNGINQELDVLYQHLLSRQHLVKTTELNEDADLWIDEIQHVIDNANEIYCSAIKCCEAIAAINAEVQNVDNLQLINALANPNAELVGAIPDCAGSYREMLQSLQLKKDSEAGGNSCSVVVYKVRDGISFYYDCLTRTGTWSCSDILSGVSVCLSRDEIQTVLVTVTREHDRQLLCTAIEPLIEKLQASIVGYLFRSKWKARLRYLISQEDAVITIQAWWKGRQQHQAYLNRLEYLKANVDSVVQIQSLVRMYLARKKYRTRLQYMKNNSEAIIKIQSCWRASKTRRAFQELMTSSNPSFSTVQMFVHLLDINNLDFSEELELYQIRADVVKAIRRNQNLEKDLCTMDVKIGLLVKNRITLQDVVAHGKKMDKKNREWQESAFSVAPTGQHGLKTMSKESRQRVEAYQHLFYLLQMEPRYLSRLLHLSVPGKVTKFLESVVLTLFNYASNQREEYLLLKLFKTALQEEIRLKVDQPSDIVVSNPLIIKMIVGFNRNRRGQSPLRDILGPLVKRILEDKDLQINTNPVEVYKAWVNQMESQTGQPSGLPYNVTQEKALEHEQVQKDIETSVVHLKETTLLFFNTIINSFEQIPYGILYMARVLKINLEEKFPDAPLKDILKVVGNLLYYRYINSAIIAPDAFDIVDIGASQNLTNEQRLKLGSVAKILQFATSKTGFGDESPHLVCLNPFIIDCHEKFKKFFSAACETEELEAHFKIDEYTEATMMTKPVIYMSLQDICELHLLCLEHESELAPDTEDPLHELLEDLGEKPNVEALIGQVENMCPTKLSKTEICLTLTNKFEIEESTKTDTIRVFVRTKQMVVDAMHCLEAPDVPSMLKNVPTDYHRAKYDLLRTNKNKQNVSTEEDKKRLLHRTPSDTDSASLDELLVKVQHNLNVLELDGYVSSKNDYQDVINTIALDIRNRRRYRIRRKQDLLHLRSTLGNLKDKATFFEEQVDYYNQYIKKCLDNMATGSKKARRGSSAVAKKLKSKLVLKYTAAKLHDKGIITDMDGLSQNQFKNVLFEIAPTDVAGVFGVKVKYMGTGMADIEIDIQNLLELQYEGVSLMKMFDRAQINVNLLLYLLNSKFYGKS